MNPPQLTPNEVDTICQLLKKEPTISQAILFGSRAKGTAKKYSDIDLALKGSLSPHTAAHIAEQLNEETLLPYFFDVLDYHALTNPDLRDHIDRVGICIYPDQ